MYSAGVGVDGDGSFGSACPEGRFTVAVEVDWEVEVEEDAAPREGATSAALREGRTEEELPFFLSLAAFPFPPDPELDDCCKSCAIPTDPALTLLLSLSLSPSRLSTG